MTNLPEYCYDCPCYNGESGYCQADKGHRFSSDYRPFWCPLVKIDNEYIEADDEESEEINMTVEEMALRSEIRQMLNEAGFNRETIKQMVKDAIDDIVKNQVNQVLMERKEKDLGKVVEDYLNARLYKQIQNCTEGFIKEKLRWFDFTVNVQIDNKAETRNKE